MARKRRIEITGGLYHIITRGNNRRRIFRSQDDYLKFLAFLESQKAKRPFYLYAYCLMPNHVHLLAEMLDDPISRVMHGLLTFFTNPITFLHYFASVRRPFTYEGIVGTALVPGTTLNSAEI